MTVYTSVTDANNYIISDRIDKNFGFYAPTTVTIANGVATVSSQFHKIEGEGATTDSVNTISGGKVGQRLILTPNSTVYSTTISKMTGGVGNIGMPADVVLSVAYSNIHLLCTSTGASGTQAWIMIAKTT